MRVETEPRPKPANTAETAAFLVAAMVASAFGVCSEAIHATGRGRAATAFARQVAIYLSHTRLGLTYTEAGAAFGRDRTTAAHACRTVENRRDDKRVDTIVDCLERAVDVSPVLDNARRWRS